MAAFRIDNDGTGWGDYYNTGDGVADTSDYVIGTQSMKVTTQTLNTLAGIYNEVSFNLTGRNVRIYVKSPNWSLVSQCVLILGSDGWTLENTATLDIKTRLQNPPNNEWIEIIVPRSAFEIYGSPDWGAINMALFRVKDTNSSFATVKLDSISSFTEGQEGVVSITFDDGYDDMYDVAKPILDTNGFSATAFIIPSLVGETGYVTQSEVNTLHSAGWDISGHSDKNLTTLTSSELTTEISNISNWLSLGNYKGRSLFAYPFGAWNSNVINAIKNDFTAGLNIDGWNNPLSNLSPFRINRQSADKWTTVSMIKGWIDKAVANKEWCIINFHTLVDTLVDSQDFLTSDFTTIIEYLNTNNIPTLPVSEVLEQLNYTRENRSTLDGNDIGLSTVFTTADFKKVSSDDDSFLELTGSQRYSKYLFKKTNERANSSQPFTITWKGKSTVAPSSSTVYLQVYNRNSGAWETVDSDSSTGADTEFPLEGTISTNTAYYYDSSYTVSVRVYQDINPTLVTKSTSGTTTWTCPTGVTSAIVRCWGGGASGGGISTDNVIGRGGGGAGGQYAEKLVSVTPGTNYTCVVAATRTAVAGGDGQNGYDTTFGGTLVVAKGGYRGRSYENGGAKGWCPTTGGVGDIVYIGGSGSNGGAVSTGGAGGGGAGTSGNGGDASGNTGGSGTSEGGGNGGNGISSSGNGVAGIAAGGGGSAGGNTVDTLTTNRTGGNGAMGRMEIEYSVGQTLSVDYINIVFNGIPLNSVRGLYSKGSISDSSTRQVYTKGVATGSSNRSLYTKGTLGSFSERGIYSKGISTNSSTRQIYTRGSVSDSSERGLYTKGISTSSSQRDIYTKGVATTDSERGIYSKGSIQTFSNRTLYTKGVSTNSSQRGIFSIGSIQESSQRDIYTKGIDTSSSEKSIYTTGSLPGSSSRQIHSKGIDTSSSSRSIHSIGGEIGTSERLISSKGKAEGSSERGLYTIGDILVRHGESERLLYTRGAVSSFSTRTLYSVGSLSGTSLRGLYTVSSASVSSERSLYLLAAISTSSERSLYIKASGKGESERSIYLRGEGEVAPPQDIFLIEIDEGVFIGATTGKVYFKI